jgi:hypothetical protein
MKMNRSDLDPRWENKVFHIDSWHFHRRLLERYGIVLGPGEYTAIKNAIVSGKAPMVQRRPNGNLYWVNVESAAKGVYVLARGKRLVTVWLGPKGRAKARRSKAPRKDRAS